MEKLSTLRCLSGWSGPRQVVFDSGEAGVKTSALINRIYPSFAIRPVFTSLLSPNAVSELVNRSQPGAQIIVIASQADCAPALTSLLGEGKSTQHAAFTKSGIRQAIQSLSVVDVESCIPDIPTALLHTIPIQPPIPTENEQTNDSNSSSLWIQQLGHDRLKSQISKIINELYVPIHSLTE
jgi:hypothetical protein